MASKKRKTTTDATKAKLPLPANHPQKRKRKAKPKHDEGFHPIGTPKFDAEKAREFNAPRAIPCGEDVATTYTASNGRRFTFPAPGIPILYGDDLLVPPPDTSAYPWPLKFAWKLDGWLAKLARRFA